jgi:hypothetical protein
MAFNLGLNFTKLRHVRPAGDARDDLTLREVSPACVRLGPAIRRLDQFDDMQNRRTDASSSPVPLRWISGPSDRTRAPNVGVGVAAVHQPERFQGSL